MLGYVGDNQTYDEKQRTTPRTRRPNLGPLFPGTRPTRQSQKASYPSPSPQRPRTRCPLGASTLSPLHDGSSHISGLDRRPLRRLLEIMLIANRRTALPIVALLLALNIRAAAHLVPGSMDVHWNEGASD